MIFLEIETVFASKIWARYWGNLAGNPHWVLNWSRFAMWGLLISIPPRRPFQLLAADSPHNLLFSTLPLDHFAFIRALRFEDSTPLSANLLGPGLKCTSEQKTIGRTPIICAYICNIWIWTCLSSNPCFWYPECPEECIFPTSLDFGRCCCKLTFN